MTVFEYKVLTQKDKRFSGKLDPVALEESLNSLARDGWRVTSTFTVTSSTDRSELMVLLEREVR